MQAGSGIDEDVYQGPQLTNGTIQAEPPLSHLEVYPCLRHPRDPSTAFASFRWNKRWQLRSATRHLADLGARVVKVERRQTGDFARHFDTTVRGMSSAFVWLNRSKESLTVDLKHIRAAEILDRLLAGADVFIQNLAPGSTGRLSLDAATLTPRYPRLIVCDISGYGSDGPYRDKKAYDMLVQAEAGVLSLTGTVEDKAKVGISIADIAAGMYAFSSTLAALLQRSLTGEARPIQISLFDSLTEWMSYPLLYTLYGGTAPRAAAPGMPPSRPTARLRHPIDASSLSPSRTLESGTVSVRCSWTCPPWRPTSDSPPTRTV